MPTAMTIRAGEVTLAAELNESETARAITSALPIRAAAQRWGKEIYFPIPVEAGPEAGAREVVEKGTLGYWPVGRAFCLFWGATPASQGDEIRAASAVNIIGRMLGDLAQLNDIGDGVEIVIEKG